MDKLKVVSIGGFGHSVFVFDDMMGMDEAMICGLAPAYAGEDISFFTDHALCVDAPRFATYQEMLTKIKPDVAIISTRLDCIADVTIAAAEAGCHLICEKPLALKNDKLQALHQVIEKTGVNICAMLSMRSEPQFIAAQKCYQSGAIGEAVIINSRKSYKWGARPEWFSNMDTYGGTIGWIGVHALDFINYITGLTFTSVSAMGKNFSHPERKDCDDNCCMILEMNNGGHATVSVDLFRPASSVTHGDDWIRIVGTKGIIEASGATVTCTKHVDSDTPINIELEAKPKIFRTFLLSLINNTPSELNAFDAFMLTDACHCGQQSLARGEKISINSEKWISKGKAIING